jgi:hypothetical protein
MSRNEPVELIQISTIAIQESVDYPWRQATPVACIEPKNRLSMATDQVSMSRQRPFSHVDAQGTCDFPEVPDRAYMEIKVE